MKKDKSAEKEKVKQNYHFFMKFNRIALVVYAILILYGIYRNDEDVVLLGSIICFYYGFLTLGKLGNHSKLFQNITGTFLANKKFVSIFCFGIGLAIYILESDFHLLSNILPFSFSKLEEYLMWVSLVLLIYDSW